MYYRCKLPHYQPPEGTFFITYRLFGSIPQNIIQQIKTERDAQLRKLQQLELRQQQQQKQLEQVQLLQPKYLAKALRIKKLNIHKQQFAKLDNWLDLHHANEPYFLKQPAIANIVQTSLHYCAKEYFTLWAYTIMSNHVHILISLKEGSPVLYKVLQDHKRFTARQANILLQRTGNNFWEKESYDHLLRPYDKNAFGNITSYIANNPIKAGLVKNWEDWPYTYLHPELYTV